MPLASCVAFHGQPQSLRRMRQVLSWAFAFGVVIVAGSGNLISGLLR